jgi:hypothetical protein
MGRRTTVWLEDDLTGGRADATVRFGLDGRAYEIDLSAKNAQKLRKALARYISAGRRVSVRQNGRFALPPTTPAEDSAAIRQWARDNGYEVRARGRIPATLRAAYQASSPAA